MRVGIFFLNVKVVNFRARWLQPLKKIPNSNAYDCIEINVICFIQAVVKFGKSGEFVFAMVNVKQTMSKYLQKSTVYNNISLILFLLCYRKSCET